MIKCHIDNSPDYFTLAFPEGGSEALFSGLFSWPLTAVSAPLPSSRHRRKGGSWGSGSIAQAVDVCGAWLECQMTARCLGDLEGSVTSLRLSLLPWKLGTLVHLQGEAHRRLESSTQCREQKQPWEVVRDWGQSFTMNSNGQREHGPSGMPGSVLAVLRVKGTALEAFIKEKYLQTKD